MASQRNPYTTRRSTSNGKLLLLTRGREHFSAMGKVGGRVTAEKRRFGVYSETRVLLPVEDKQQLSAIAKATGVSLGAVMREAVTFYLAAIADEQASAPGRAGAKRQAKDRSGEK